MGGSRILGVRVAAEDSSVMGRVMRAVQRLERADPASTMHIARLLEEAAEKAERFSAQDISHFLAMLRDPLPQK